MLNQCRSVASLCNPHAFNRLPFKGSRACSVLFLACASIALAQDVQPANPTATPQVDQTPERRAPAAPLDGIFPGTEYLGPTIGVPDTDPIWPLTLALWDQFPQLKKSKIK